MNLKGSHSGDQNVHGKKTVTGIKGKEFVTMCIWIGKVRSSLACFFFFFFFFFW
jgi:hypothetical protein